MSTLVGILAAAGFGSIAGALITGWFNRPKTKAEAVKSEADAQRSATEAASLMIDQLQEQVETAILRAEQATERADKATERADAAAERASRALDELNAANRKIDILSDQLASALGLLQRAGHDVQRFYQILEERGVPLTTFKGPN